MKTFWNSFPEREFFIMNELLLKLCSQALLVSKEDIHKISQNLPLLEAGFQSKQDLQVDWTYIKSLFEFLCFLTKQEIMDKETYSQSYAILKKLNNYLLKTFKTA